MRLLLFAILLVQAAPAQSEADRLEAALKKFGDRSYRIRDKGAETGTMTLKTRIEGDGDRKIVVIEDQVSVKIGEFDVVMTISETSSIDGLRLRSAKRTGVRPNGKIDWSASIKDGKAFLRVDDRESTIDVTPGAVGELAVLRLVCAAEQKEGSAFKADVLSLVSERHHPGHAFRCLGKEAVEIRGKQLDAFKWEEKGEWKFTRKIGDQKVPGTSSVNNTYWVSPDGYLLRFTAGHSEMVLDAK